MDCDGFAYTKIDSVDKIDLLNKGQFDALKKYCFRNMETVNFWLNHCVFPNEMQHFPERMTASSWNLAKKYGGWVVGFSGTNDNHRLLPQQVSQYFVGPQTPFDCREAKKTWMSLMGTNGEMLDCRPPNTF
jgi:hypothetical protein